MEPKEIVKKDSKERQYLSSESDIDSDKTIDEDVYSSSSMKDNHNEIPLNPNQQMNSNQKEEPAKSIEIKSNLPSNVSSDEVKINNQEIWTRREERLPNEKEPENAPREGNQKLWNFKKLGLYLLSELKTFEKFVREQYSLIAGSKKFKYLLLLGFFLYLLLVNLIFPFISKYILKENCSIENKAYFECEFWSNISKSLTEDEILSYEECKNLFTHNSYWGEYKEEFDVSFKDLNSKLEKYQKLIPYNQRFIETEILEVALILKIPYNIERNEEFSKIYRKIGKGEFGYFNHSEYESYYKTLHRVRKEWTNLKLEHPPTSSTNWVQSFTEIVNNIERWVDMFESVYKMGALIRNNNQQDSMKREYELINSEKIWFDMRKYNGMDKDSISDSFGSYNENRRGDRHLVERKLAQIFEFLKQTKRDIGKVKVTLECPSMKGQPITLLNFNGYINPILIIGVEEKLGYIEEIERLPDPIMSLKEKYIDERCDLEKTKSRVVDISQ